MEQLAPNTPLTKNANVGGVGTQKSSQNGQGTIALQNNLFYSEVGYICTHRDLFFMNIAIDADRMILRKVFKMIDLYCL